MTRTPAPPSALARALYKHLRRRLRLREPSITYGDLADAVGVHRRSSRFHAALGEVTEACFALHLPCLPAIVWRRDARRPSAGYYRLAHPRARTEVARRAAWEREHARVVRCADLYPATLGRAP